MRIPKYRHRKDRDRGFVEYRTRRIYFPGRYDSPESVAAYHDFVRRIVAESQPAIPKDAPTIADLVAAYLDHAAAHYLQDGKPGPEYVQVKSAVTPLLRTHADMPVADFGPCALKAVRKAMINGSWIRPDEKYTSWCRSHANHQINRLRTMFRWGVEHELVSPDVLAKLRSVAPLRAGKSLAWESRPVQPVEMADVEATLPWVSPVVAAMIRLQSLTGMRSDNLVKLRPCDLDRSREIWLYEPASHKSAWRGRRLFIPLGPRCQKILTPFLERPADLFCFSPIESEAWRRAQMRSSRRSKVQPSQTDRSKPNPQKPKRTRYTTGTYRQAIKHGIAKAAKNKVVIPHWHPHQLRHTIATAVGKQYGIEGAQHYLGHKHADVTKIYDHRDLSHALRIAGEIG